MREEVDQGFDLIRGAMKAVREDAALSQDFRQRIVSYLDILVRGQYPERGKHSEARLKLQDPQKRTSDDTDPVLLLAYGIMDLYDQAVVDSSKWSHVEKQVDDFQRELIVGL